MPSPSPILLLTVDTLRRDRFTRDCFPRTYDTFTSDFAEFSSALSHGNATPFAFPAILTSRPAVGDGSLPREQTTIAELVDDRPCAGFSNNGHLTRERGYDRGFDSFHDLVPPDSRSFLDKLKQNDTLRNSKTVARTYRLFRKVHGAVKARNGGDVLDPFPNPKTTADVVTDFVQRRLAASRDSFVWAHYMDPHKPFHPDQAVDGPEIDRTREEIKNLNSYKNAKKPVGEADMMFLESLYESNIRYLDRELSRLFAWLREQELYEDSLIVVVGDHGELFGEHDLMFHPWDVDPFDELIQTPLLVKYPGGRHAGESFDHLVQHADISPTLVKEIGLSNDLDANLAHPLTDETPRHVVSKSNVSVRVTEADGAGIKRRDGSTTGTDLLSEVGRQVLDRSEFPKIQNSNDEEVGIEQYERRERLKALGYQ